MPRPKPSDRCSETKQSQQLIRLRVSQRAHWLGQADRFGQAVADRLQPVLAARVALLHLQHELDVGERVTPAQRLEHIQHRVGFLRVAYEDRSKKCSRTKADSRMPKYRRGSRGRAEPRRPGRYGCWDVGSRQSASAMKCDSAHTSSNLRSCFAHTAG